MPALLMTAAEIAAAEALAAEILIAQQAAAAAAAAAEAAQIAQAAQTAQAAQATATAANAATNQSVLQAIGAQGSTPASAAQMGGYGGVNSVGTAQASTNGIQALTQEVVGKGTLTAEQQVLQAFRDEQAKNVSMTRQDFLNQSFAGPGEGQFIDFSGGSAGKTSLNPLDSVQTQPRSVTPNFDPLQQSQSQSVDFSEGVGDALGRGSYADPAFTSTPSNTSFNALADKYFVDTSVGINPKSVETPNLKPAGDPFYNINSGHIDQTLGRPGYGVTDVAVEPSAVSSNLPAQPATGLQGLIDKSLAYAQANPLQTAYGAMTAYNILNQPKPYEKPKYKSTFDPSTYRPYEPEPPNPPYRPQYARGGLADLGSYSDYARGGRMLKGPGDGMSDDIPATIANKQPARLANEEFVIPADVVSHLGNGSSEAGAKVLYKMMDRVRRARTGTKKQGKQINPEKYLA